MLTALKRFFNGAPAFERIEPTLMSLKDFWEQADKLVEFTPDILDRRKQFMHLVYVISGVQSPKNSPHPVLGPMPQKMGAAFTQDEFSVFMKRSNEPEDRF